MNKGVSVGREVRVPLYKVVFWNGGSVWVGWEVSSGGENGLGPGHGHGTLWMPC